jgi:UDP-2,3-diacylglucosamine pyrophosphatase LpxH
LNYRVKNVLYRLFQTANRLIKRVRRLLRLPYWSLATTVNRSVAAAASLIANYEEALAGEARCQGMDGVVCGHIHHAALRDVGGVLYCNTGDWVRQQAKRGISTAR